MIGNHTAPGTDCCTHDVEQIGFGHAKLLKTRDNFELFSKDRHTRTMLSFTASYEMENLNMSSSGHQPFPMRLDRSGEPNYEAGLVPALLLDP